MFIPEKLSHCAWLKGSVGMQQLVVTMFGRPAVYWKDKLIAFPFSKMEAMLYYLLVQRKATREEMAGLLWSDMEDGTAKKNLRNTLYLLKKLLCDELIVTTGRSFIEINPSFVGTVDVYEFSEDGEGALAAYKGSFLEGFFCREAALFEEWAAEQREKYRERYISRLTKYIVELMNAQKNNEAKQLLQLLIRTDDYNESAYRALMRIYEREGAYNKVMQTYNLLADKLNRELGIVPNEKTREIYDRVHSRSAIPVAVTNAMEAEVFFGREQELSKLAQCLENFRSRSSGKEFIMLHGEQGVGKSALLSKFLATALPVKELVLQTCCYEPEVNYPYKAWSAVFGNVMKILSETGIAIPVVWRQIIAHIFPSAVDSEGWQELDTYFDGDFIQPGAIEEVLCGILEKLSKTRKIILLIEDIHWLDLQGLCVLKSLFRSPVSRILCVATCRSEHAERLEQVLSNMGGKAADTWLEIEAFKRDDVVRFSELVLPPDKNKPHVKQKLYDYTGGNALFLTECIKLIQLGQDVESLSPKLQSVLNARIIHLSANSRKVLDTVSAFIREAAYDTLAKVCGCNELELVEALDEILHRRLLIEHKQAESELSYNFTHVLIRDYIYSKMSSSRQKMIHQRIAVCLEQKMSAERKERDLYSEALHHYTQAGHKLKVLEYTIKLAERFSSPHYEMFPEDSDDSRSASMLTDRLQITNYLQEIGKYLEALPQDMASDEALYHHKAAYLEMLGRYRIWRGEHHAGLKVIHELLKLAADKEYPDYLIKGYQQIAYCGIEKGRPRLVELFAGKLLQTAGELNWKDKMATALRLRGYARAMLGDYVLAEQDYRQSIDLFRHLPDKGKYATCIGAAYSYIGDIRRGENQFAEALQYYEKAITLYGEQTISEALSIICINAGTMAFELADYAQTEMYFGKALRISDQFGGQMGYWCRRSHCGLEAISALMDVRQGKPAEALQCLRQAECFLERPADWYALGVILRAKADIAAQMERDGRLRTVFASHLTLTARNYYRQSEEIFRRHNDRYQLQALAKITFQNE